jgi:hypothetical protein
LNSDQIECTSGRPLLNVPGHPAKTGLNHQRMPILISIPEWPQTETVECSSKSDTIATGLADRAVQNE